MTLTSWDVWCWIIGVVGFIVLTTVLIVKKRYKAFPWFTGLLMFEILQTCVLFLAHRFGAEGLYFGVYWIGEILEALIRVGVMFELAKITARQVGVSERRRVRPLFISLLVTSGFCLFVIIKLHGLGDPVVDTALKISVCTSILTGFLAFAVFPLTFFDGIRIRAYARAVTFGMVAYFFGKLVSEVALLLNEHGVWLSVQNGLKPIYILCLFAWSLIFWFDEPKQILTDEMERWRILGDAIHAKAVEESGRRSIDFTTSLIGDLGVNPITPRPKIVERRQKVEHNSPSRGNR